MPEIPHEPLDLMTVLEVEPRFDDGAFCNFYLVKRGNLTLDVALPMAEPRAEISLWQEGKDRALVHFSFWCAGIRRVVDERGELLEFLGCVVGNIDLAPQDFLTGRTPTCSIHVWIKPQIRVQLA